MIPFSETCCHCDTPLTEENIANIWECFDCAKLLDQINNQKHACQPNSSAEEEDDLENYLVFAGESLASMEW